MLKVLPSIISEVITNYAVAVVSAIVGPLLAPLREEIASLKRELSSLRGVVQSVGSKTEQIEAQDRRNNLCFRGIPETVDETWSEAEVVLRRTLRSRGIPSDMPFERVHRLGPKRASSRYPRVLIAKFSSYKGRDAVFSQKSKFKGLQVYVDEDFLATVKERRNVLLDFALAKVKKSSRRFRLRYPFHDVLIEGRVFTLGQVIDANAGRSESPLTGANASVLGQRRSVGVSSSVTLPPELMRPESEQLRGDASQSSPHATIAGSERLSSPVLPRNEELFSPNAALGLLDSLPIVLGSRANNTRTSRRA